MKKHLKTYRHHYVRLGLIIAGFTVSYFVSLFVLAVVKGGDVSYAATYDSTLRLIVVGDYHGSMTVSSVNHSVGTCSSAAGQEFTVSYGSYTTCQGVAMGSPDGMQVYLPGTQPSGYQVAMTVTSNTANGPVSCSGRACSLNYSSGSVTVQIVTTASQQPRAPTAYLNGVTSSSMSVYWSGGSAGSYSFYDYLPYINGNGGGTTANTSMTYSGLSCNTRYNFFVVMRTSAGNYTSNTVYATTSACPAPPPSAPAPSPAPSPTPTSSPSGGGTKPSGSAPLPGSGSVSSTSSSPAKVQNNTNSTAEIAQTLPQAPQGFTASSNEGSSTISLYWDAGSSSSPVHYVLERSTNQQEWVLLTDALQQESYSDTTTLFSTQYYYRLTAVDESDLRSPSIVTDIMSDAFKANAGAGHDMVLISKDKFVRVTIPSAALDQPANCSFADNPSVPLAGERGYETVGGPYQLICQHADASIIQQFKHALPVKVSLPESLQKHYKHIQYQAYAPAGKVWQPIRVATNQTSLSLNEKQLALVILGQPKHTPGWIIAVTVLVVLAGSGAAGLALVGRAMQRRRAQAAVDDYWHKMNGV